MNLLTYYSPYLPYTFIPILLVALYFQIEKYFRRIWMRWAWWLLVVVGIVAIGWYAGANQGWGDFYKAYYYGARKILNDPSVLYDQYCYGYTNFPLMTYLFVPFVVYLPKNVAGTLFFVIGYEALIPMAYLLIKNASVRGWKIWLVLILLSISGPLDNSISMGNDTHLITLIILVAFFFYQRGHEWLTGVLIGINGSVKIPLIVPAGYFLIRRKWKIVAGGMLVVVLIVLVSLGVIPFWLNRQWIDICIVANAEKYLANFNNQSVVGVLARILIPGSKFLKWTPQPSPLGFQIILWIARGLLLLPAFIVMFYQWKSPRSYSQTVLEFFIVLTCSLLISPISWTHYFVFLMIPTSYYIGRSFQQEQNRVNDILMTISLILLALPTGFTYSVFQQTNQILFLSIHFIGGLVFYLVLLLVWMQGKLPKRQKISASQ